MVKFDITAQTFSKIEHFKEEWELGKRRFQFKNIGQLFMFYMTSEHATIYILNIELRWEYVKKFDHSKDWKRMDVDLGSPFLTSSALLKRFLLFKKPQNSHVWRFDLVKEASLKDYIRR